MKGRSWGSSAWLAQLKKKKKDNSTEKSEAAFCSARYRAEGKQTKKKKGIFFLLLSNFKMGNFPSCPGGCGAWVSHLQEPGCCLPSPFFFLLSFCPAQWSEAGDFCPSCASCTETIGICESRGRGVGLEVLLPSSQAR